MHLRMLGLLAVAAAALMALAGSASATTVTSSSGTTPNVIFTSSNIEFDGNFKPIKCNHSRIEGNIESHGAGATVAAAVDSISFSGCNYEVTITSGGSLQVHSDPSGTTGDGTITSTGLNLTFHSSVGVCTVTTNATDVGTLDGGSPAVWYISSKLPRTGGNFLCGSTVTWTGNYSVDSPSTLEIH